VLDAAVAQSKAQEQNMWRIREAQAEVGRLDGPVMSFDTSVPPSRILAFIEAADAAVRDILPDIRPAPLGHIGDGNLHYTLKAPIGMAEDAWRVHIPTLTNAVNRLIQAFHGSISAEHGIGLTKRDELAELGQPAEIAMMRPIKRALDPTDIMNPGKIVHLA